LPLLYAAIIVAPMTAYLYLAYPDWSWLYLFPADRVPRLAVIPAVAAGFAAMLGGWVVVGRLLAAQGGRSSDPRRLLIGLAGGAALLLVFISMSWTRIASAGTYADLHAGRAQPIFSVKLGFVLTALAIAATAAAVFVGSQLRRDARKASVR
jgi:hypothetical protein